MTPIRVQVGMPLRDSSVHFMASLAHQSASKNVFVTPTFMQSSILTLCFNSLWCGALNAFRRGEATHFAMLHSDVLPSPGWLDVLLHELQWYGADIVSAVVPLKDPRGLTSTALDNTGDPWNPYRLTLAEVFQRSETFTDPTILLNTGCWVCRLDKPWCQKVWFEQRDQIRQDENGDWHPDTAPEDWNFSRAVRAAGGTKLFATRKVKLDHERPEYTNRGVWGTWKTDENHIKLPVA